MLAVPPSRWCLLFLPALLSCLDAAAPQAKAEGDTADVSGGFGGRPTDPEQSQLGGSGGRSAAGTMVSNDSGSGPEDRDAAAILPSSSALDAASDPRPRLPVDAAVLDPGPASVAACKDGKSAVCIDFEDKVLGKWKASGAGVAVATTKAAHGTSALYLPGLVPGKTTAITTTDMGGITNVMYGRFYLYLEPAAPNGHGALLEAFDQAGNWYELGFQFSNFHGNWHPTGGASERWMNSKVPIPGSKWSCVEFLFDGSVPAVTKIWSDDVEVKYNQVAKAPELAVVTQFKRVSIGFFPFHGTSIAKYEGVDPPALTEMWIDDIALDSKRIGCIR